MFCFFTFSYWCNWDKASRQSNLTLNTTTVCQHKRHSEGLSNNSWTESRLVCWILKSQLQNTLFLTGVCPLKPKNTVNTTEHKSNHACIQKHLIKFRLHRVQCASINYNYIQIYSRIDNKTTCLTSSWYIPMMVFTFSLMILSVYKLFLSAAMVIDGWHATRASIWAGFCIFYTLW